MAKHSAERSAWWAPLLAIGLLAASCNDDPLLPPLEAVAAPFPSDLFTVDVDGDTPTGLRVALDAAQSPLLEPVLEIGVWRREDLVAWLGELDGFSTFGPILWTVEAPLDPASLVTTGAGASVRLVDLARPGEALPVTVGYAEAKDAAGEPLHVVHLTPSLPLLPGRQHAVIVLRQGVRLSDGGDPGQSGFFEVLSGARGMLPGSPWDKSMARVAARARPLLDHLDAAGIARDDVAHAFLFTTQSARATLRAAREQLRGAAAPPLSLSWGESYAPAELPGVPDDAPDPSAVARVLKGRFDAPDLRDGDGDLGLPLPAGQVRQVPFILALPKDAGAGKPLPVVVLQHGHGGRKERALYVAPHLAERGIATAAIDHVSHGELAKEGAFIDVVNPKRFRGNLLQSAVNGLRLVQLLGSLEALPEAAGGARLDTARGVGYIGESLGAITGVPLASVEPDVGVAVFNVGGGGLAASLGGSFLALFDESNPLLKLGAVAVLQTFLDRADPVSFAGLLHREATPERRRPALLQHVVADDMGPETVSALAHALGATYVCPCPEEMPLEGLPRQDAPASAPAVFYFPEGNHGFLLANAAFPEASLAVRTQAARFFADHFAGREPQVVDTVKR